LILDSSGYKFNKPEYESDQHFKKCYLQKLQPLTVNKIHFSKITDITSLYYKTATIQICYFKK